MLRALVQNGFYAGDYTQPRNIQGSSFLAKRTL
jgi:hypothetical protein